MMDHNYSYLFWSYLATLLMDLDVKYAPKVSKCKFDDWWETLCVKSWTSAHLLYGMFKIDKKLM